MDNRVVVVGLAVVGLIALTAGGCPGNKTPEAPPVKDQPAEASATLPVIGHGAEVDLKEHLVAGKTTVFDFYSEQCPACMMLAPELEKLAAKRSDLAIIKVDVNRPEVKDKIDWDSPVAQQHKPESLPHLVIFDPDGKESASGDEAQARVMQWIER